MSFSLFFQFFSIALLSISTHDLRFEKTSTIIVIFPENSSLDKYLYNISILISFHSIDVSTFEIDNNLSLSILATGIANSGIQTIISSTIQKCFRSFGMTVVTKIAIFQFIFNLSSLSFIIQEGVHAFVFFDSQTIIHELCPKLFFTVCIKSAHFIPVGTSSTLSIGNAHDIAFLRSSSCISH